MLRNLSIIGAVAAILVVPTALSAQMGAVNPGVHVGGAVNPGATVRGAVERTVIVSIRPPQSCADDGADRAAATTYRGPTRRRSLSPEEKFVHSAIQPTGHHWPGCLGCGSCWDCCAMASFGSSTVAMIRVFSMVM